MSLQPDEQGRVTPGRVAALETVGVGASSWAAPLLRSKQPVVVCPTRDIDNMRIPREWSPTLGECRLLVVSLFPGTALRPTSEFATQCNDLVADLAQRVLIAHVATGSKTETFARKLAASGNLLLTLDSPPNTNFGGDGGGGRRYEDDTLLRTSA